MADWGGYMNKSSGFIGGVSSMRDEEFDEQDVWGTDMITKDKKNYSTTKTTVSKSKEFSSSSCSAWNKGASPRKIPRANNGVLLPSSDEDRDGQAVLRGSSAPMDIPDWSKIYGKKKDDDEEEEEENEDDDGDGIILPPHEWIARK
ncbi:hypothetical protein PIB30_063370, partial [Stylosanthes scabra]|nr:hypothetical protein [Stylosanthes scabra]